MSRRLVAFSDRSEEIRDGGLDLFERDLPDSLVAKATTGMFSLNDGFSRAQQQSAAVCIDFRRTIRPDRPDQTEPLLELFPEFAWPGIIGAAELPHQTRIAEQRRPLAPP
jgi:hypothetical protein